MEWMVSSEDLLKLFLALVVGGLIGLEREFRDKAAGFRTLIFICVGAVIFTIMSVRIAGDKDPGRVAAGVVTGVGFLGAGVILREGQRVIGLTTAATIWLTAALGMGIGVGQYALSLVGCGMVVVVLWIFPKFEHWLDNIHDTRSYAIYIPNQFEKVAALEKVCTESGLKILNHCFSRSMDRIKVEFLVRGTRQAHIDFDTHLLHDPEVIEFTF
jgi:putative Mg2+ transporter-C (MgtC) family protein